MSENKELRPTGKYAPLSAWAYFGYSLLFSLPIAGIVLVIVMSINGKNINRRSYARSYIIPYVIMAIALVILLATGTAAALLDGLMY